MTWAVSWLFSWARASPTSLVQVRGACEFVFSEFCENFAEFGTFLPCFPGSVAQIIGQYGTFKDVHQLYDYYKKSYELCKKLAAEKDQFLAQIEEMVSP